MSGEVRYRLGGLSRVSLYSEMRLTIDALREKEYPSLKKWL